MYELLVDAEEHILSELKDGAKMSDVYNSTIEMVKKEKPELVIFHFNPSGYSGSVG
jgi:nucleosome binding factor SPN SPT16 subunit